MSTPQPRPGILRRRTYAGALDQLRSFSQLPMAGVTSFWALPLT
jgi:hypothetical protein